MRDFAKLTLRLILLLGINAVLGWAVLCVHEAVLPDYAPWETDSRLLIMPENTYFGAAFLGTSHAYLFSRFKKNHAITESELGCTVFNMALPTGGGVRPARFYFETFLARGNRCDVLVYFLDPFVFFATGPNDGHKFVWFEPFRLRFFLRLALDSYPHAQLIDYVRSKFGPDWLFQHYEPLIEHTGRLTPADLDPGRIRMRRDSLYYQGLSDANFRRYRRDFTRIARRCEEEGIPLVVIIPPTLLGPEAGAGPVIAWLKQKQARFPFIFQDDVDVMPEPRYYYNLDHLNTKGVRYFMRHHVATVVKDARQGMGTGDAASRALVHD